MNFVSFWDTGLNDRILFTNVVVKNGRHCLYLSTRKLHYSMQMIPNN